MARARGLKDTTKDANAKDAFVQGGAKKKQTTPKEELQMVNARLPKSLIMQIKIHCISDDISVQDFMTAAVTAEIKRRGGEKKIIKG